MENKFAPISISDRSVFLNHHSAVTSSSIEEINGRKVVVLKVGGGSRHGAITAYDADTMKQSVQLSGKLGIPFLTVLNTSGSDITEGPIGLHVWGSFAGELARLSGVVPTVAIVTGACVSGPSLILGLVDFVMTTADAFAYVSGPGSVLEFTGVSVTKEEIGSPTLLANSGVGSLSAQDEDEAIEIFESLLEFLPDNHLCDIPIIQTDDEKERETKIARETVPENAQAGYDMHDVLNDVFDLDSVLEIRPTYAPNMLTCFALLNGRSVGIIANQPIARAGTIDIEASRKAARFVSICDAYNIPIVTFVDTPGFEPGKDLEWRGMIRHGAELVYAYAQASVPRLCLIIRKSYGGAYIVMDSKNLGNDWCGAWPTSEIAVMGASGAVAILNRKEIAACDNEQEQATCREGLIKEYETKFSNPNQAGELGYVDAIIEPLATRSILIQVLESLISKKEEPNMRKHGNSPL